MSEFWDNLYSNMISLVPYKVLVFIPPLVALLMAGVVFSVGLEYGIDFRGGTLLDISTSGDLDAALLSELESDLYALELQDLKLLSGRDYATGENKLTIATASVINKTQTLTLLSKHLGSLREFDEAQATLESKSPQDLDDKLSRRLKERVDVIGDGKKVTIRALDLDEEELASALSYYSGGEVELVVNKKNLNVRSVGPTLGRTFRRQGIRAVAMAFFFMSIVVFVAFRDFIPSVAVIQAATVDAMIALGGMVLLGIPMEPASLAALLMLIGYSVDSDVLLTARVLRERMGEVDYRINEAMKTGLVMTGTTLAVMSVVYVVTTYVIPLPALQSISSILLLGLTADLFTTWFTNAGILKWYLELPTTKRKLFKRR